MISYQDAYKKVDAFYRRYKLGGIGVAGDADTEWIFQAKEDRNLDPVLVNKETGMMHPCRINIPEERRLMYSAVVLKS